MSDWDSVSVLAPISAVALDRPIAEELEAEPPLIEADVASAVRLGISPAARDVREALLALPEINKATIDASEVERISAPVLQVLLAAMQEAAVRGSKIAVLNPSFAFTLAFEAFGLGGDNEPFTVEFN